MADERQYPDISFVDTDTERLVNALIGAFESMTKRKLAPADPARQFILWMANIMIQDRIIINESAKQNVPRYASGDYLDSLADLFKDLYRIEAQAAQTTLRFFISAARGAVQVISKGTRVAADQGIVFETVESLEIPAGALSGDVKAVCQTAGAVGNGFTPGQITQLMDVYPFYERVENITASEGGADRETDTAFYQRMRENMESFSTAGSEGSYIYHAKTASALIADVSVDSPSPGVVDVRVLLENGVLPDAEMLTKVRDALSDDKVRPLTDCVNVLAPVTVPFEIEVVYYIHRPNASSAAIIQRDAENALITYIRWQTGKMGRDINPSRLISLLMATGVKRVDVAKPGYLQMDKGAVAVLNEPYSLVYGGVEDE